MKPLSCEGEWKHIFSEKPIQGVAPGQFGVLYDEHAEICVGSGEIGCPYSRRPM